MPAETAAAESAAAKKRVNLTFAGSEMRVVPHFLSQDGDVLNSPEHVSNPWPRLEQRLVRKAEQAQEEIAKKEAPPRASAPSGPLGACTLKPGGTAGGATAGEEGSRQRPTIKCLVDGITAEASYQKARYR